MDGHASYLCPPAMKPGYRVIERTQLILIGALVAAVAAVVMLVLAYVPV